MIHSIKVLFLCQKDSGPEWFRCLFGIVDSFEPGTIGISELFRLGGMAPQEPSPSEASRCY